MVVSCWLLDQNMGYKTYIELDVWKESRNLVVIVYDVTKKFPKEELFGLTAQMRKAAISIPSNIAEGCGRNHTKESIQFLHISRGSLFELETQLYLAFDQGYFDEPMLNTILEKITACKKLLNGFINYYDKLK